ncbi:phosphatidylserine/phosphatidylglycerophosphate/cardiolipin synthase family protein [Alicyclobacillus sp.]|uniref:phospholipase D-like domain-containing protein n=1 Tax=Alicyclobacillus sp. TaxID=61169 RepID=UPI0025BD108A|nr:phospholipase D-like domain-containing protein [Alicyclobacillus sp.]MCL6515487.1 phosphatidylserine/phosphatidylglycerophosphate/cardiolipin synthase family protein [Alicyclobacillus sp.]
MSSTWRTRLRHLGFTLALILVTLAAGCLPAARTASGHHTPAPAHEAGMTLVWEGDVKAQALALIRASRRICHLDIYELSDPEILSALADARHRGVDVRVVVDATEKHSQDEGVPALRRAGVPVASLHIPRGISHIKMLVTDDAVLIGGMNFGAGSWDNNDASVVIEHPNDSFDALFRWDWQRAGGHPAAAPAPKAPLLDERKTEQHVVDAIAHARQSVAVEAFVLSDWAVVNALEDAAKRGIAVAVLLDPGQSQNRRTAEALRKAGAVVRFYKPYGGEWMHAKMLDVDHGDVLIIGSANFSHQAYTYNHEGDVELHGVHAFAKAMEDDLAAEMQRGTVYPTRRTGAGDNEDAG